MKKLIVLFLSMFMVLTIVGCGDEDINSSTGTESNSSNVTESSNITTPSSDDKNESSKPEDTSNNSIITPSNTSVKYETKVIDGQYYLIPIGNNISSDIEQGLVESEIKFKSVNEFVGTLKKGDFTGNGFSAIKRFEKDESGRIKICNPNKIYEPVAPKGYSAPSPYWSGETYAYIQSNLQGGNATFFVHTEKTFNARFEDVWNKYFENANNTEDGYTETYFSTFAGEFKRKRYKLETNVATYEKASNKIEVYVVEKYRLKTIYSDYPTSSEIPYQIIMFAQKDDLYYEIQINANNSPVTPEWLMQFGLKPIN